MGAGSSLEAAFSLRGPIAAGTWRLVGDGIILEPVDVTFEIIWRHGGADDVLATFEHHFDPLPNSAYVAQAFEDTAEVDAVDASSGDLLVLRYSGQSASLQMAYIPDGEGDHAGGRIPFIELPR